MLVLTLTLPPRRPTLRSEIGRRTTGVAVVAAWFPGSAIQMPQARRQGTRRTVRRQRQS